MKKIIVLTGCCLLVLSCSSAFAGVGLQMLNLKNIFHVQGRKAAVILPHYVHQAKVACASCHVNPQGGGNVKFDLVKRSGMSNDFHKKWCWPCHVEMKVPKGKSCSTCHSGS